MSNRPMSDSPRILGLFAKKPRAGDAKTRLAAETSPAWAEQAATAFLLDSVAKFATLADERVLVFTPVEEQDYFAHLGGSHYRLHPQTEGDLGRRMRDFFVAEMQTGQERIVVLGTDSPTLPVSYVERAFGELETNDVALGPALDGGYYLHGCARRLPPVFEGITWSGRTVLAETIARLDDPTWKVALLPPWYDVDTLDDWLLLRSHLSALRRAGIDPEAPRTEQLTLSPPHED
jgi:rSAM/selenodomain-associated transferase 1